MEEDMGVDEERVINAEECASVLKRAICPICLKILWDPVRCAKCRMDYCKVCIHRYVLHQIKQGAPVALCPNRCVYTEISNPVLLDFLSDLKFRCINESNGCKEQINYDSLEKHDTICGYRDVYCYLCTKKFLKKEKKNHAEVCEKAKVKVDCCQKVMQRKDIKVHQRTCGGVFITLPCCLKQLKRSQLKQHNELKCFKKNMIRLRKENEQLKLKLAEKGAKLKKLAINSKVKTEKQTETPDRLLSENRVDKTLRKQETAVFSPNDSAIIQIEEDSNGSDLGMHSSRVKNVSKALKSVTLTQTFTKRSSEQKFKDKKKETCDKNILKLVECWESLGSPPLSPLEKKKLNLREECWDRDDVGPQKSKRLKKDSKSKNMLR
jgi:hypothetical protein